MNFQDAFANIVIPPVNKERLQQLAKFVAANEAKLNSQDVQSAFHDMVAKSSLWETLHDIQQLPNPDHQKALCDQLISGIECVIVDTKEALQGLVNTLKTQHVIVLAAKYVKDSYLGVTSLLGIGLPASGVDFVVDCLELKDHMYLLREELLRDSCLKLTSDPQNITAL